MNSFKRAILSIKRRPKKTILLFLIVFFLGNFIAISFSIKDTTEALKYNIKSGLGSTITIHAKSRMENDEVDQSFIDVFKKITNDDSVSYFDYGFISELYSNQITDIQSIDEYYDKLNPFAIKGVYQNQFLDLYQNDIIITEGRTFTEEEIKNGDRVIIIPENIVDKSVACSILEEKCSKEKYKSIQIGDEISFQRVVALYPKNTYFINFEDTDKIYYGDIHYKVIGKYRLNNNLQTNKFWPNLAGETISYSSNRTEVFYMPMLTQSEEYSVMQTYNEKSLEDNPNSTSSFFLYILDYLQIMLKDPADLNEYVASIKKAFGEEQFFNLEFFSSSDSYDAVAGSVESLSSIATIIIVLSIVISVILLGLSTTLFMRDRKHEMGTYLALGEKKAKIIFQVFLEIYLVGLLAITLSLATGDLVGRKISESIISNQNEKQEYVIKKKLELLGAVVPEELDVGKITEKIESNVNAKYVISMYLVSSCVLAISVVFPSIYLLKLEPKKILM